MDLGADGWQTFRRITFPAIATALVAGALLAFALSFDEIIVTLFTAGRRDAAAVDLRAVPAPQHRSEANAVAVFVMPDGLPVYLAQRLMRDTGGIAGRWPDSPALQPAAGFGSLRPYVRSPVARRAVARRRPERCGLGSAGRRRGRGDVGRPASADTLSQKRAQAQAAARLAAIQHEAEARIEAYDAIHQKMSVNTRNALRLNRQSLRVARANLKAAEARLTASLTETYKTGGEDAVSYLLAARSIGELVDQMQVMQRVNGINKTLLNQVTRYKAEDFSPQRASRRS